LQEGSNCIVVGFKLGCNVSLHIVMQNFISSDEGTSQQSTFIIYYFAVLNFSLIFKMKRYFPNLMIIVRLLILLFVDLFIY
jgi:hypothetical protein